MTAPESGRHSADPGPFFEEAPTERIDRYDMPTDPSMRVPLNRAPRHVPPVVAGAPPRERYQDLVVPRVFVEPDEQMDELRQQSLRWAIWRDRVAILVMLLLMGVITRPVWVFLAEAIR